MADPFGTSAEHPAPPDPPPTTSPLTAAQLGRLLQRVARQDRSAFARLYEATAPKLLGTALRILHQRGWAEDVVQEAYVKIWQKAGHFDARKASPITWMVTIVRNGAIDELRKQPPGTATGEDALERTASSTPDGHAQLEHDQSVSRLHRCLDELPEARRDMVRLAYLNGWSRADLATHFEQPVNTVKTWLHRALKQLKGCLAP
ncbi:sigma-70 family RNA polymerase sigma factor [Modicisalibacter radicis]|uniref:sigma-70 family RNA polymerase sigma factor n=1 Tax=Halomonas sp. EAR18 TaxID=2518972 RepID=UPI00109D480A|nr:sigma-70 family RNA polymerase sigma factor [Halomonas sp. EAR18]